MILYTPEDLASAYRLIDERLSDRSPEWLAMHRDSMAREHARWCRFERETREAKALGDAGMKEMKRVA